MIKGKVRAIMQELETSVRVRANVFWWHKDTAVSKSASLEGKVKLSLS
jgi:hypothetical protein